MLNVTYWNICNHLWWEEEANSIWFYVCYKEISSCDCSCGICYISVDVLYIQWKSCLDRDVTCDYIYIRTPRSVVPRVHLQLCSTYGLYLRQNIVTLENVTFSINMHKNRKEEISSAQCGSVQQWRIFTHTHHCYVFLSLSHPRHDWNTLFGTRFPSD